MALLLGDETWVVCCVPCRRVPLLFTFFVNDINYIVVHHRALWPQELIMKNGHSFHASDLALVC